MDVGDDPKRKHLYVELVKTLAVLSGWHPSRNHEALLFPDDER